MNEVEELIKNWDYAVQELARAKSAVNRAECDVSNTRNALGKWLMPDDAIVGEKFSVWHGTSLIEITVTNGDPLLKVRK